MLRRGTRRTGRGPENIDVSINPGVKPGWGEIMSRILEQAGFTRATRRVVVPRLVLSVEGPGKVGKTTFSLSSDREPILYINANQGDEGVIDKYIGGRGIWRMDMPRGRFLVDQLGNDQASKEAGEAWKKFSKGYKKVVGSGGTVILDTGGEMWELLRLYRFGKLDQVKPHHYAPVNAEYEAIFALALDQPDLTLIAIHELKDQYINEKFTGKRIRSSYKRVEYLCQVLVELYKTGTGPDRVYGCRIMECRHSPEVEGMELEGDMCTFPMLRDLVLS